jgi:hypothetical protein
VAGPPSHPETGITSQGSGLSPGRGQRTGWSRWKTAVIAVVVVALLAVMVILHLTGTFGAGTHG